MPSSPVSAHSVGYLVKRVELGLRSGLDEHLRGFGLTTQQYSVLIMLSGRDGLSAAELARHFRITPQAMSQIVTGMEMRGLISRRPDEYHRRILRASLDDNGRRVLEGASEIHRGVEEAMLADLDADQVASLQYMLTRCAASLHVLDDPQGESLEPADEPIAASQA